jgi:hypothetical protein
MLALLYVIVAAGCVVESRFLQGSVPAISTLGCPHGVLGIAEINLASSDANVQAYSALLEGDFEQALETASTEEAELARSLLADDYNFDDPRLSNCTHLVMSIVLSNRPESSLSHHQCRKNHQQENFE